MSMAYVDPAHLLAGGPLAAAGGVAVFDGLPDRATCNALALEARTRTGIDPPGVLRRRRCRGPRRHAPPGAADGRGRRGPGRPVRVAVASRVPCGAMWHADRAERKPGQLQLLRPAGRLPRHAPRHRHVRRHADHRAARRHRPARSRGRARRLPRPVRRAAVPYSRCARRGRRDRQGTPGQSIVILGGLVPHRVERLGAAGQRIISALCFRAT